ncbi:MAG: SRPBCC domain-containing protein [Pseudomonadota bacterium]
MATKTTSLTFERSFSLPPARLWTLLTDPKMREAWGAPSEDAVLTMEISDLREGGFEIHHCGPKEAPEFTVETRWYKLNASEDACYTETLVIGGEKLFTSLVTYALAETATGTDLGIHVAITSFGDEDMTADIQEGWEGGLANLVKLAAAQDVTA